MIRGIIIGVLSVAVVGTAYWGYQEHQEKNAILINAENNYQRAFHDLAYNVDLLHDKIGNTLAMNSRKSLSPALADVWRLTSEAHTEVGQLPLTLLPFNKTEEFLSNIGDFSYKAAVRDLEKEPLSTKEYNHLQSLYEQSADIQGELRQVQHVVLTENLRWMDVELALASGEQQTDNTIIDGFKTVEKKVEGYSESGMDMNTRRNTQDFSNLKGKDISEEEAVQIAREYIPFAKNADMKVTKNGDGARYGFYSISVDDGKKEANMDITEKGGYPIFLIQNREIQNQKLSLNDALNKAEAFLNEHNFENMTVFESTQYDNTGVFSFVTEQDGVRIYPDMIRMKVALDDGSILSFTANDYLSSNKTREIPQPTMKSKDAKESINPNVKIMEENQAIILNDSGEEVLCYEYVATLNNDTYRIYVNSENGDEERVDKLQNAEQIYENMV